MTEHQEQVRLIEWWKKYNRGKGFVLFAIPNGGERNIITAGHLKKEGVLKGVPDLFLAQPNKEYSGLFVEMKKKKGGVVSDEQKKIMALLERAGYKTAVCKGAEEAVTAIHEYLLSTV